MFGLSTCIAGASCLISSGADQAAVDSLQAVDLGTVGHHEHRAIAVCQRQMAALREQQVEV